MLKSIGVKNFRSLKEIDVNGKMVILMMKDCLRKYIIGRR